MAVAGSEPAAIATSVLEVLLAEARDRHVARVSALALTGAADDVATSADLRVGATLAEVASALVDAGADLWVTPDRRLHLAQDRGTARGLVLAEGVNLLAGQTRTTARRSSRAYVRTARRVLEMGGAGREVVVEAGGQDSDRPGGDAERVGREALRESTPLRLAAGIRVACVEGAVPHVDVEVGDTIGLDTGGGPVPVRVLSIAVTVDDAGQVTWEPELEVL